MWFLINEVEILKTDGHNINLYDCYIMKSCMSTLSDIKGVTERRIWNKNSETGNQQLVLFQFLVIVSKKDE